MVHLITVEVENKTTINYKTAIRTTTLVTNIYNCNGGSLDWTINQRQK